MKSYQWKKLTEEEKYMEYKRKIIKINELKKEIKQLDKKWRDFYRNKSYYESLER